MEVVGSGSYVDGNCLAFPWKFTLSTASASQWKKSGSFHGYAQWKLRPASTKLPYTYIRLVPLLPSTFTSSTYLHLLSLTFSHIHATSKTSLNLHKFRLTSRTSIRLLPSRKLPSASAEASVHSHTPAGPDPTRA